MKCESPQEWLLQLYVSGESQEGFRGSVLVSSKKIHNQCPHPWSCITDPETRGLVAVEGKDYEGLTEPGNSQDNTQLING